ncbi:MAG: hypothetical protein O6918_00045, partial [Deltaproteobacteria bacterium]|nr:hypothetical protein [Deltaproteobacteria bacterium]
MIFRKVFRCKIWHPLFFSMLAVGFYGCPPGGLIQEEQEPATTPPAMVAQTQTPTEENPVRSPEPIKEATLEDV